MAEVVVTQKPNKSIRIQHQNQLQKLNAKAEAEAEYLDTLREYIAVHNF